MITFLSENSLINLVSLLFVILLIFCFSIWKESVITKLEKIIKYAAVIIFIGGYIIYFIGFTSGTEGRGTANSWMAFIFRPTISSLEMFVSHSDLIEVDPALKANPVYMTFYSLINFSAIAITGIFAVYYLGARMISWIKWNNMILFKRNTSNTLHIFFDANEASMNLAADIRAKDPDANNEMILLYTCSQNKEKGEKTGLGNILSTFSARKDLLVKAYGLKMFIKSLNVPVYLYDEENIISKLKLIGGIKKVRNISIYFLSQDENANILSSLKIKNDPFIASDNCKDKHIRIFCRSSKSNANAIFEQHTKNRVETIIVDNSFLSVWSLRTLPLYRDGEIKAFSFASHPVNFIDIDPDLGIALSPFHCAIIGFGETGQEALRFLYEYGQFVYPEEMGNDNFKCDVFDSCLNQFKGRFLAKYPKLGDPDTGILWNDIDQHCTEFWDGLKRNLDSLNYVVLSMGDDEKDMTLAVDIFNLALRYRKNGLKHFGIFVRSYDFVNEKRMEEIATEHANRGEKVINIFGKQSDIYTRNRICDDKLQDAAAIFSYTYNLLRDNKGNDEESIQINADTISKAKEIWSRRHNESRKDYAQYMDVMRDEALKLSEAYHIYTKMKLAGLDEFRDMVLEASDTSYVSLKRYKNSPFLTALERLEHKRWCACLYAMGYLPMSEEEYLKIGKPCDVIHKRHRCLVEWDKLSEFKEAPYQYYQQIAVTTSFGLFYNKELDEVYRGV
jgi:hypothetical protein